VDLFVYILLRRGVQEMAKAYEDARNDYPELSKEVEERITEIEEKKTSGPRN